jgi:hypothetical protein
MNTPTSAAWAALAAVALYATGYLTWAWDATFPPPAPRRPLDDEPAHVIARIARERGGTP